MSIYIGHRQAHQEHCATAIICNRVIFIQLIPSSRNVTIDSGGFYFFYTLFGNDVITEKFLDILDPKFTAEKASVRIRTSLDVLRLYLNRISPVQVMWCPPSIYSLYSLSLLWCSLVLRAMVGNRTSGHNHFPPADWLAIDSYEGFHLWLSLHHHCFYYSPYSDCEPSPPLNSRLFEMLFIK